MMPAVYRQEGGQIRVQSNARQLAGLASPPAAAAVLHDAVVHTALALCNRRDIPREMEEPLSILLAQAYVRTLGARGLVAEADRAGLELWEQELGLPRRPDLTEEGRRSILLAALDRCYDGTAAGLAAYVQRLTGKPAQVQPDYPGYGITVELEDTGRVDRYSVQHWVDRCLPAHIAGSVE